LVEIKDKIVDPAGSAGRMVNLFEIGELCRIMGRTGDTFKIKTWLTPREQITPDKIDLAGLTAKVGENGRLPDSYYGPIPPPWWKDAKVKLTEKIILHDGVPAGKEPPKTENIIVLEKGLECQIIQQMAWVDEFGLKPDPARPGQNIRAVKFTEYLKIKTPSGDVLDVRKNQTNYPEVFEAWKKSRREKELPVAAPANPG
jgi:hypothetical protein